MDDYSPRPLAPSIDYIEDTETPEAFLVKDAGLTRAYFHKDWKEVQDLFEDKIEALRVGCTDLSLPADEYKIEDISNKKVAMHLKDILMQVQNAVTSTEQRKRGK